MTATTVPVARVQAAPFRAKWDATELSGPLAKKLLSPFRMMRRAVIASYDEAQRRDEGDQGRYGLSWIEVVDTEGT